MLTLVLDSYSFQCSLVWDQLPGQFLSPLVDSTHLLHFLGQASFPFLCLRRDIWLRGRLWKSCENAVLSTWDGEVWEKCNNFVGEEDVKRCSIYMGEGKVSSNQSWAWDKNISSNSFKPRWCFCLLNWGLISWTGPNWMLNSKHREYIETSVNADRRPRSKCWEWCVAFWFYFCQFTYQYSFIQQRDAYFVYSCG